MGGGRGGTGPRRRSQGEVPGLGGQCRSQGEGASPTPRTEVLGYDWE